ncbi:MAG: hypothetical protein AAFV95_02395 [Bacteroidota bacterium]
MSSDQQIQCPQCNWQPTPSDLWDCQCGHSWHTFDTQGQCPACKKQWRHTQCHPPSLGGCGQWSLHIDWYRDLDKYLEKELQAIENVEIVNQTFYGE